MCWKKVWPIFWLKCSGFTVQIFSRISRIFSREMGQFFSHLARNEKREKCASLLMCPFSKRKWYAMNHKLELSWNRQDFANEFCLWIFQKSLNLILLCASFKLTKNSPFPRIFLSFNVFIFSEKDSNWRKKWVCKLIGYAICS